MVYCGLTDNYIRVYADSTGDLSNRITLARLVEIVDEWIYAPSA